MKKDITIHRFTVPVNCAAFSTNNTDKVQDSQKIYFDNGVLMLPKSYSKRGKPTRLIINCHGAGGSVNTDDSQIESQVFAKYLLANGYAIMDVNGLPEEYSSLFGVDIKNNVGSPIALQCYVKAYHYCIDNFNLKKDVFVHGGSMGGISSANLVLSNCIPVIAHSAFCPVLDTFNQIFLHPWSNGLPKTALGVLYDFEKDKNGEFIYDFEKVVGYNPVDRIIKVGDKEYLSYPVPVKFWQCENDDVVSIEPTKRFIRAIKNSGGIAHLRTFLDGKHEPSLFGELVLNPSGNTLFNGETLEIKPAVEEAYLWIKRFD